MASSVQYEKINRKQINKIFVNALFYQLTGKYDLGKGMRCLIEARYYFDVIFFFFYSLLDFIFLTHVI